MSVSSPPRTTEHRTSGHRLPARLRALAAAVPDGAAVADIGSGDGLLAAHLARTGPARLVIASENKSGPLAVVRAAVAGLEVDLRLGEGLEVLVPGEVSVVVIAGMGGHRIASLLSAAPAVVARLARLVLQPMQHSTELVDMLEARGFGIQQVTSVTQAGRAHTVLVVVPPYSETDAGN